MTVGVEQEPLVRAFILEFECERVDLAGFHVVGVFEVDAHGKIASWRDYVDSREIATKVGPEREQTGG
jgi:limonene-1,2-epoxide hydrolase